MPRAAAAAAAVAVVVVATATAAATDGQQATRVVPLPRLPMEAHSFNDLAAWPQLLRKGVRWIKTDYSYCSRASCEAFSSWNSGPGTGSPSDCYDAADGGNYCCICMRGDASSRPDLTSPFNTTWDLLALLSDPALIAAGVIPTTAGGGGANPLMIGLDFGGPSVNFWNATEAAMAVGWLTALNVTIAAHGLAVRPYFDATTSGWFNALDIRCAAGNCTPGQAALQALPWPSETGDALPPTSADPYNRYAILNSDESDLWDDCQTGSWNASLAKAAGYPYLWYEPSSQIEYLGFFDFWADCPSVPADKRPPNTGVVVVSNQATEMFETYASSAIGRGMNALLLPTPHSAPALVVVPLNSSVWDRAALLATAVPGGIAVTAVGLVDGQPPTASDIMFNTTVHLPPTAVLASAVAWQGGGTPYGSCLPYVVAATSGEAQWFTWCPATGTLTPAANATVSLVTGTPGAVLLSLQPLCSPSACTALVAVGNGTAALTVAVVTADGSAVLASTSVQDAVAVTAGASLSVTPPPASPPTNAGVTAAGLIMYGGVAPSPTVPGDNRTALFGAYVEVAVSTPPAGAPTAAVTVERAATSTDAPVRITLGTAPHVITTNYNGTTVVLASHTDGLCQCGLLQNNDDTPHCLLASDAVDDNPLLAMYQSVQYLLNYNFGTLDAFRRVVNGTTAGLDAFLGACHSEIASGKFENGAGVSGALYPRLVQYINSTEAPDGGPVPEIAALFAHDGNVIRPLLTTVICGSPLPKAGIVFDQFRLLQSAAAPFPPQS